MNSGESTYFSLLISFIFVTSMSLQSCTEPVNVLSNCPIVWNDLHIWKKWHKIFPLFWVLKYNHATLVVDVVDPGQDKLEKLKDFCGCLTIWFNIGSLLSNQCRHGFLIIIIAFLQSNPRSSLPPSSFIFNILLFIQNPAVLAFIILSLLHQYLYWYWEITSSWHSCITWPPAPKLSHTSLTVAYPENLPLHIPPECFSLTSHSISSHWHVHPSPPPLQHFLLLPCCSASTS